MSSKLQNVIASNPALGFITSSFNIVGGAWAWFRTNSGDISTVLGIFSLLIGIAAGWYTIRAQRVIIADSKRDKADQ